MKNILISATAHMGDFIWVTSAVSIIKKTFPDIKITVLAPESIVELLINNPVIDDFILSPFSGSSSKSKIKKLLWAVKTIPSIYFKKFGAVLILESSKLSIIISKLARIPKIAGGDLLWAGYDIEDPAAKYYTDKIALPKNQDHIHMSLRFQTIVRSFFGTANNALPVLPDSSSLGPNAQKLIKDKTKTIISLCIKGSANTSHIWSIENFRKVIDTISSKFENTHFYIVGTKADYEYARQIADDITIFNICGKTSVLELREFFKRSKLLISLDTGTIHVAATTDISILSLHGMTSPEVTGPVSHRAVPIYLGVECSPCAHMRTIDKKPCPSYPNPKCVSGIPPDMVSKEAIKILAQQQ